MPEKSCLLLSSPYDLGVMTSRGFMVEGAGDPANNGGYVSLPGPESNDCAGEFSNLRLRRGCEDPSMSQDMDMLADGVG